MSSQSPADLRIIAPYGGTVTNTLEVERPGGDGLELEDSGAMLGLYVQWIRAGSFQGNLFGYFSPEVNYSTLLGLHSNFDRYFDIGPLRNLVLGGGLELISIDTDAADAIDGLDAFSMRNTIIAPFARTGKQFGFGPAWLDATVFPWAGGEVALQRGEIELTPTASSNGSSGGPPGPIEIEQEIDETDWYGLAGVNLRATIARVVQLDGKFHVAFDEDDRYRRGSLMMNVFVTHNFGLSWRFSHMETSAATTRYHIFGFVVLF